MLLLLLAVFFRLVAFVLSSHPYLQSNAKPRLVFSVFHKDIHIVNLDRLNNSTIGYTDTDLFMNTTGVSINISEIDFSIDANILIWRMCEPINTIYAAPIDNRKKNLLNIVDYTVLINLNKTGSTKSRVSIDWIHNLIYFNENNQIIVTNMTNPKHAYTVVTEPNDRVLDIAVNPIASLLVWSVSDDKYMNGKIKTSLQDGSRQTVIVKDMAKEPITLAIDYASERVYWIDRLMFSVSSVNYDGIDRKTVFHSKKLLTLTYFMDVFGNYIFWSSYVNRSILKTSKFGNDSISFLVTADTYIEGIKIIDRSRQPLTPNRCKLSNCSYLCLPVDTRQYRCVCPKQIYYGYNFTDTCAESVYETVATDSTTITTRNHYTSEQTHASTATTVTATTNSDITVASNEISSSVLTISDKIEYNSSAMSDRNCVYVTNYKTSLWFYVVIIASLIGNMFAICGFLYILRNRKRKLALKVREAKVMRAFKYNKCDARNFCERSYLTQSNPLISLELIENQLYWEVPNRNSRA